MWWALTACAWITDDDVASFSDADGDGAVSTVYGGTDCDDSDAAVNPDAEEVCDGIDNNCDDQVDEGAAAPRPYFKDLDGDGWGNLQTEEFLCDAPPDRVDRPGDCDDGDPAVNEGADEVCDGVDNDCDGDVDSDAIDAPTWYGDKDQDGYGADASVTQCDEPNGTWVLVDGDCDDDNDAVNEGAEEVCGDDDDDCDGSVDEGPPSDAPTWYEDGDGDGYGVETSQIVSCDSPSGYADRAGDCDDADGTSSPGHDEVCDLVDHDCDGRTGFKHNVPGDYPTIQDALDAAGSGEPICVSSGTYAEAITLTGDVILHGMGSSDTVLDGTGLGRVVGSYGHPSTAEFVGFTIQGGDTYEGSGLLVLNSDALYEDLVFRDNQNADESFQCHGTLSIEGTGSPLFRNVVLRENLVDCSEVWGLVNISGPDVVFENFMMVDNLVSGTSYATGGISGYGSGSVTIENGVFAGNIVDGGVGSVFGSAVGAVNFDVTLTNVTIVGNEAVAGSTCHSAAVYAENSVTITNTTVTGNQCNNGAGAYAGPGTYTFTYSNTAGNSPTDFGIVDPTGTNGNIGKSPQFNDTSSLSAYDWDLTLKSASALIDAGDPAILDVDGTTSDIGAHGGPLGESW